MVCLHLSIYNEYIYEHITLACLISTVEENLKASWFYTGITAGVRKIPVEVDMRRQGSRTKSHGAFISTKHHISFHGMSCTSNYRRCELCCQLTGYLSAPFVRSFKGQGKPPDSSKYLDSAP